MMPIDIDFQACLLEKIAAMNCANLNILDRQSRSIAHIDNSIAALIELYRMVHPEQALQLDRLTQMRADLVRCCPDEAQLPSLCEFTPCEHPDSVLRDGWSRKSTAFVALVECSDRHRPWKIVADRAHNESDDQIPPVRLGTFRSFLVPSVEVAAPLDAADASSAGSQAPINIRQTGRADLSGAFPPDMSGATAGQIVLMTGNLWLKLSVDGGSSFVDLDFTKVFAADTDYGGWAGDQVVQYVPAVDSFVLYVQSYKAQNSTKNAGKNIVKVALASPADLKKFGGDKRAWTRQWHFTSDTHSLGQCWMDFPDLTFDSGFLYVNTTVFSHETGTELKTKAKYDELAGKLFFELPLADLKAGRGFGYRFSFIHSGTRVSSRLPNPKYRRRKLLGRSCRQFNDANLLVEGL